MQSSFSQVKLNSQSIINHKELSFKFYSIHINQQVSIKYCNLQASKMYQYASNMYQYARNENMPVICINEICINGNRPVICINMHGMKIEKTGRTSTFFLF